MKTCFLPTLAVLALLGCQSEFASNKDDANDAAGTGDPNLAREVTGMWLLSTDYNYEQRCNYLPPEFAQSLFKLPEDVALEKWQSQFGCELRGGGTTIGFFFERQRPFESTFQSEFAFDQKYQPQKADSVSAANPTKAPYTGPATQGVGAERPSELQRPQTTGEVIEERAVPHPNSAVRPSVGKEGVQNTFAGVAVPNVGDKALWEPAKNTLHVLHNNHILHVFARMPGPEQQRRDGAIGLAKYIIGHLNNPSA